MNRNTHIFSILILVCMLFAGGHYAWNTISVPKNQYIQLKQDAATLPKEIQHNDHMASSNSDLIKENIDLKSKVETCAADKSVAHIQAILAQQDAQITLWREKAKDLQDKLNECEK